MTHTHLIKAIAEELRDAVKDIKFPIEYHTTAAEKDFVPVNVFEIYIPDDLFEQTSYYPCIVVEYLDTTDKLGGGEIQSVARIGLSFGVFAKEKDGWQDCFHLMEVCRERLLRRRLLAERFRLADEVTWEFAETQPRPFMFAYCELSYYMFQLQEVDLLNAL